MPPRLLDVMTVDTDIVRLVELHPPPSAASQYAYLSYCWVKIESQHITKVSTLECNLSGMLISKLPRTYRDAIEVSRLLQIRYLWIDSLCIIQDSQTDWTEHVHMMASIYQNAHVTSAAGARMDDDGGFFVTVPDEYMDI
jgi:hypothetical protein